MNLPAEFHTSCFLLPPAVALCQQHVFGSVPRGPPGAACHSLRKQTVPELGLAGGSKQKHLGFLCLPPSRCAHVGLPYPLLPPCRGLWREILSNQEHSQAPEVTTAIRAHLVSGGHQSAASLREGCLGPWPQLGEKVGAAIQATPPSPLL